MQDTKPAPQPGGFVEPTAFDNLIGLAPFLAAALVVVLFLVWAALRSRPPE